MTANPKILLVDDEAPITANLAPFLERTGFQVVVASDGEQALQQITESKPDLVVMDVLMPRLDGREVLRRLRREGNWIPIILLTQVGESVERAMALEEGAPLLRCDHVVGRSGHPLEGAHTGRVEQQADEGRDAGHTTCIALVPRLRPPTSCSHEGFGSSGADTHTRP